MFMVYLRAKFQMPSFNNLLVIAIKPRAKYRIHTAAILLFYVLHEDYCK
jgi:hypothetical protein